MDHLYTQHCCLEMEVIYSPFGDTGGEGEASELAVHTKTLTGLVSLDTIA